MIGIIGAMDIEVTGIKALLTDVLVKNISGIEFVSGKYKNEDVVVARCGIGKVFAALCAEAMILSFSPRMIINVGVAGALDKMLDVGDVVIASHVLQHDMDTSPLGDPKGLLSGINIIEIPANEKIVSGLAQATSSLSLPHKVGKIASGDQFVASREQKKAITENFGADSCEMEGGAIGHVCYINDVPFGVLRTMSDRADGDAKVDYPTFCKTAADNNINIIKMFLDRI